MTVNVVASTPARVSGSIFLAVLLSTAAFYVMQALISAEFVLPEAPIIGQVTEFVRPQSEAPVVIPKRHATPPPPPELPPVTAQPTIRVPGSYGGEKAVMAPPVLPKGGAGIGLTNGDPLPLVKVQPVYPRRALARDLAGWVVVEFDIGADGSVRQPRVVGHCAAVVRRAEDCEGRADTVFDKAALAAVLKFRYRPKVEDGVARVTRGVRNRLSFNLAGGRP